MPRRLTLDFSDLTKKGFEFRVFKGDFVFKKGNAFTRNAYLDGPVAKVSLQGRIGFANKDVDLKLSVAPYVTSSLPLIVGVAGGPIAGVVTWVVSKILSPSIGKAVGFTYKVTGPWKKPKVHKLGKGK